MSEEAQEMVNMAMDKNASDFKETVETALKTKVMDTIDTMKREVSGDMMGIGQSEDDYE